MSESRVEPGRVDPDELAALEEQRRFLLASLADLDREWAAGDLDPEDYATLRDDYTARAAAVIHALAEGEARLAAVPTPSRRRRWATVAVVAVVAIGAGLAVAYSAGERQVGEGVSGSIRQTSSNLLAEARVLVARGDAVGAVERFDQVLAVDPDQREALTYKGWLLVLAGLTDEGVGYLDRAVEVAPTYPDARFFRAFVRFRDQDDPEGAMDDIRVLLDHDPPPDFVPQISGLVEEIRAALVQRDGTTTP